MNSTNEAASIPTPVQDAFGQVLSIDQDPSCNWAICDSHMFVESNFSLPGYSGFVHGLFELCNWLIEHYPRAFSYARLDDPVNPNGDALKHACTFNPEFPAAVIQQCLWEGGLAPEVIDEVFGPDTAEAFDLSEDCRPKLQDGETCAPILASLDAIRFLRYSCPTASCIAHDHPLIVSEPYSCPKCANGAGGVSCGTCHSRMEVSVVYDAMHLPPFLFPLTSVTKEEFHALVMELHRDGRLPSVRKECGTYNVYIESNEIRTVIMELIKRRDIPLHIAREFLDALEHEFSRAREAYAPFLDELS